MDSSTEHLVQVRGTTAVVDGRSVITSLILVTNKATYGPCGGVRGRRFQSTKEGKVVGFFGTASTVLHQLGVITLIYAPPGNGLCIRCTTPYLYCCSCTVQHSPVPRPFGPGSTGSHITTHHLLPRPSLIPGTSVVPVHPQNPVTPQPHQHLPEACPNSCHSRFPLKIPLSLPMAKIHIRLNYVW